jgi:hypothetical protein
MSAHETGIVGQIRVAIERIGFLSMRILVVVQTLDIVWGDGSDFHRRGSAPLRWRLGWGTANRIDRERNE